MTNTNASAPGSRWLRMSVLLTVNGNHTIPPLIPRPTQCRIRCPGQALKAPVIIRHSAGEPLQQDIDSIGLQYQTPVLCRHKTFFHLMRDAHGMLKIHIKLHSSNAV